MYNTKNYIYTKMRQINKAIQKEDEIDGSGVDSIQLGDKTMRDLCIWDPQRSQLGSSNITAMKKEVLQSKIF